MARKHTETYDPQDFLLFATQGNSSIVATPSGLLDFESFLNTGNNVFSSVYITDDFPLELYGGRFFYQPGNSLYTYTIMKFYSDLTLLGELRVNGANDKLELVTNSIVRAIGTHNMQLHTRYHAQWRYKNSVGAGVFEVKLDNDLDILTFNGDTRGAGFAYVNRIEYPPMNDGVYGDSEYINDTTGAVNNGYDGVVYMKSFVPTADGFYVDWSTTSGTDRFAMIDETPHDSDTTICYTTTNGHRVSVQVAPHGLTAPSVLRAVSARWVVRKVSTGAVRPFFRIGGVNYPIAAASVPVGVGYTCVMDRRVLNPATGLAWTLGDTIDSVGLEAIL